MKHLVLGLLAAILVTVAAPSGAAVLTQDFGPGNDCTGLFNNGENGFENCEDPRGSPIIAKWDAGEEGGWAINSLFEDVTSDMFTLNLTGDEGSTGTWAYDRCATCPAITSFVVKAGNGFRWYYTLPLDSLLAGSWETIDGKELSHISFYDTLGVIDPQIGNVPLPLPAFLLLGAMGGLGGFRAFSRRKAA